MNRRQFLKRGSLFVAAAVVVDPLELADMLKPRRLYVPGGLVKGTAPGLEFGIDLAAGPDGWVAFWDGVPVEYYGISSRPESQLLYRPGLRL